tara:strand:- start:360 stop:701 length:342 start_codon:yes stop_codon:yes gene_type:complete
LDVSTNSLFSTLSSRKRSGNDDVIKDCKDNDKRHNSIIHQIAKITINDIIHQIAKITINDNSLIHHQIAEITINDIIHQISKIRINDNSLIHHQIATIRMIGYKRPSVELMIL